MPDFNCRYEGVLESILGGVQIKGALLSFDIAAVAASYFVRFVKSQAFLDANKRMAVIITQSFLFINGYKLKFSFTELRDLGILVLGDTNDINDIIDALTPVFRRNISVK